MIRASNINEFVDNFNNEGLKQWIPIRLNMISYPNVPRVKIDGVLVYDKRFHYIVLYIRNLNRENIILPYSQEFAEYCQQRHINNYIFSFGIPDRASFLMKGDIEGQIKQRDLYCLIDSVTFYDGSTLNPNLE